MEPQTGYASGRCQLKGKRRSDRFSSLRRQWMASCFASVFFLSLLGCQSGPDPSIELLESELRFYEDQLFMQKRELDRLTAQISSCRRYNAALKNELKNASNGSSSSSSGQSSAATIQDDAIDESDLELPDIEFGEEEFADPVPSDLDENGDEDGLLDPNLSDPDELEFESAFRTNVSPPRIAKIVLNKRLTGGYSDDRAPGSDGLSVVIEPQDESGEYVSLPGDVTIEAFAQKNGSSRRVGRWDFDAIEVSSHMRESLFGKGIHLRLPWPVEPPESHKIRLVVNYTRPDGDALLAKKDIRIQTSSHEDFSLARDAAEIDAAAALSAKRPEWSPKRR